MGSDEIQTGKPEPADNKLAAPAPVNQEGEDNPFRLREPVLNPLASIAGCLGILALIPVVMCGMAIWWYKRPADANDLFLWDYVEPVLGPVAVLFGILGIGRYARKQADGGLGCAIFAIGMGILITLLALLFFALRHSGFGAVVE